MGNFCRFLLRIPLEIPLSEPEIRKNLLKNHQKMAKNGLFLGVFWSPISPILTLVEQVFRLDATIGILINTCRKL
jgi:hypothetical protein